MPDNRENVEKKVNRESRAFPVKRVTPVQTGKTVFPPLLLWRKTAAW